MTGMKRRAMLSIISLIFIAGAVIYFLKNNIGFALFAFLVGIVFGVRAIRAGKQ
jgi:hypothetical protein